MKGHHIGQGCTIRQHSRQLSPKNCIEKTGKSGLELLRVKQARQVRNTAAFFGMRFVAARIQLGISISQIQTSYGRRDGVG